MSNLSFSLIQLFCFFDYFIFNFKFFYSAQHSRGLLFVFCLFTHRGLWGILYCLFSFPGNFKGPLRQHRYNMDGPTQTFSLVWNGVHGFSLLVSPLPVMCLSTDGGLSMTFQIFFYNLREHGNRAKQGKPWLRLSEPLVGILAQSTSQTCTPILRVLAHQCGKRHTVTAFPAGWHMGIRKQTIHHNHPHLNVLKLKRIHEKSQDFTEPFSFFNTASSISAEVGTRKPSDARVF